MTPLHSWYWCFVLSLSSWRVQLGTYELYYSLQGTDYFFCFSSCSSWALESRSVVVAHGLSCSTACGIFLDQESEPYPLHQQVGSYSLCHQGSTNIAFYCLSFLVLFISSYRAGLSLGIISLQFEETPLAFLTAQLTGDILSLISFIW